MTFKFFRARTSEVRYARSVVTRLPSGEMKVTDMAHVRQDGEYKQITGRTGLWSQRLTWKGRYMHLSGLTLVMPMVPRCVLTSDERERPTLAHASINFLVPFET